MEAMPVSETLLLQAHQIARRRRGDGRQWLLKSASLAVAAGERLAVTGPSGSGKTLLLRALTLLDPLDEGHVSWKGRRVHGSNVPAFRRRVMYLHQRPVLPEETVLAALQRPFSLAAHRHRRFDARRIIVWLTQLGRDESFLVKHTADLSGGERQMVALLRALQLDPAVLLLDEPTAALDSAAAAAVEELLRCWIAESSDARATVWVTHEIDQARRVADNVLRMKNGELLAC